MKLKLSAAAAALAVLPFAGFAAGPAHAAIQCNGAYQVLKSGEEIATPYCEDTYLAYIGQRFYGTKYSAHQVRWNPLAKRDTCLVAGHDIRVSSICRGLLNEGGRNFN